ncbi:MAG TPA: glycosyltransferase [Bacteroidales bacterium]|nr:glycosyltransferase [Bacteroidales bacterium]
MKILHIIPSLGKGGAERLMLDICRQLNKQEGITTSIFCLSPLNDYQEYSKGLDIQVINADISLSLYKKNNCHTEELRRAIEKLKPDIIHSHLFIAEIASRSVFYPDAKWFSHGHDNMEQFENFSWKTLFRKRKLTNFYEKMFLLRCYKKNGGTHFIAISNDAKMFFEKTIPRYPVTLLHNAIDYAKFYKKRDGAGHRDKIRIVNVGSFVAKKNQSFLLDIAKILKDKNIDFELHLLGDGDDRPALEEKTNSLQLNHQVFFHGNVTNVEEFLWTYDIYLHSATYEPLGLVLLEAMAAGLPVITLDGRGNRDLIEQGKNGYMLFEPNAETFAEKIIDLWNDQAKHREISLYAQEFAGKFDIKEYVDALLKIYSA